MVTVWDLAPVGEQFRTSDIRPCHEQVGRKSRTRVLKHKIDCCRCVAPCTCSSLEPVLPTTRRETFSHSRFPCRGQRGQGGGKARKAQRILALSSKSQVARRAPKLAYLGTVVRVMETRALGLPRRQEPSLMAQKHRACAEPQHKGTCTLLGRSPVSQLSTW